MAQDRSHQILEMFIKTKLGMALDTLFSGATIPPDQLDHTTEIKNTLGMRVISAFRLFTDIEIGRNLGSLNNLKDDVSDIEFALQPSQQAGLSEMPPQSLKTESLRLIYTLCDNQCIHLNNKKIPQAAEAATKLSTLREFAYAAVSDEIDSIVKDLSKIGIELQPGIHILLDFAMSTSRQKTHEPVSQDEAKYAAKAVMGLFQEHNQVRDKSQPAEVESISTKLFQCLSLASEKVAALAKQ